MAYVAKVRTPGGTWVPIAAQQADTSGFVLKTGTTGTVNLSTANLTGAGMDLITTQTFASASSVSINNCFTSSYENYRIMVSISSATAAANSTIRFRASGTDNSSAQYIYALWDVNGAAGSGAVSSTSATSIRIGQTSTAAQPSTALIDVFAPLLTVRTNYSLMSFADDGTNYVSRTGSGGLTVTTAYDGITLLPSSGTATGMIRVYGYRNS